MTDIKDVVIIGGGVGGTSVALYLARAGYKPTLITSGDIGGSLNDIKLIQNYVGIYNAVGSEVAESIVGQLSQSGLELDEHLITDSYVREVSRYKANLWEVTYTNIVGAYEKIIAKNVVVATGMRHKKLEHISEAIQHNCVLCDGFMYKDKEVIVVGGGSSAVTEAIELARIAKKVRVVRRSENYRAEKILVDKMRELDNVFEHVGSVSHFEETDALFIHEGDYSQIFKTKDCGLFVYIGSEPNSDFLPQEIKKNVFGHLEAQNNHAVDINDEIVDNLYVVGDIGTSESKQFGIAIGQGTEVGIELIKKLS